MGLAQLTLTPTLNLVPTMPPSLPTRRLSTKSTYDRFGAEVPEENSRLQDLDLYFDKNCRDNLMTGSEFRFMRRYHQPPPPPPPPPSPPLPLRLS